MQKIMYCILFFTNLLLHEFSTFITISSIHIGYRSLNLDAKYIQDDPINYKSSNTKFYVELINKSNNSIQENNVYKLKFYYLLIVPIIQSIKV